MVRLSKQRQHMGTRHKPYELPPPINTVSPTPVKSSIAARVDHITRENPTVASAAGQSLEGDHSNSPAASNSNIRHWAFFFALSSACFNIFLLRIKRANTVASSASSSSTFFWYSSRVLSNDGQDKFTQDLPTRIHSKHLRRALGSNDGIT